MFAGGCNAKDADTTCPPLVISGKLYRLSAASEHENLLRIVRQRARMNRSQFTTDHLAVFEAVMATGSVSAAADRLHLTPSTIVHHLHSFQAAVGARLFERSGRTLRPTAAARALTPAVQAANQAAYEVARLAASVRRGSTGTIAIGASQTSASYYLPRALRVFQHLTPAVHIQIVPGHNREICAWVADGDVPMGLVEGPVQNARLAEVQLFEDELVFVAARDHPLGRHPDVEVADLLTHHFVTYHAGPESSSLASQILGDIYPRLARIATPQMETVKAFVLAGIGFASLPRIAVEAYLAGGQLVQLRIPTAKRWIRAVRRFDEAGQLDESIWTHLADPGSYT